MSFIAGRDSFRILRIGMGGCSYRRSTLQEGGRVVRSPAIRMKAIPKRNRSPDKRGTAIRRRVQWRPMDSAFYIGTETVAESQFDIDDLERRKDYVVRIAELSGQAEQSYRVAYFTTAAQSGRYAGMALQSKYAVGAPVLLKAINVSDEAQLSWAVDGEATTESVVRLAAGEHEVELRVTDGGRTEIITKYIKVE